MSNAYQETMFILKKYNITANKSLGQNFLINDEVIENTVKAANITDKDLIIEIGPGLGTLTSLLLEKAKKVIAIELDSRMVSILNDRFKNNTNFELIHEDVLKVDLYNLINSRKKDNNFKVKVVANLPYYISTPIIMKLLEQNKCIDEIIVMVQKEVGQRLTASTGTRMAGAITYAVDFFAEASEVICVPKESFVPSPKVESEVIKLKLRKDKKIEVEDEKLLFDIIQKSFSQRRKTLANSLVNYNIIDNKSDVEEMFKNLEIPNNVRGESLTLEQFGKIANYINEKNKTL